ncbi:DNRLRE domain-containing protein [Clostridium luticellarii]|jgi:hypothetical protein|uniref:Carbohydrate-binding module family 96 domain-containing protein n=1 Tax=Clostridium luticellarii TaxID=1691940 RepID=A0A2T0BQW4_9CLOT|nr:DNRLRE domain-containing protein [Clostridium luticellarii]MCI1967837.1 DNRLRE domain-containing protein [Clostridium luticellarii]MCI1994715.1 DNRLRE domain-containing protein [Clostridium luticellarii]MCI2038788.1 DNRLRE domain-containing protein [Clostridium luticellarii]PRR86271.1 hypothetical protein CLLU_07520 [Clostridium luticellarii]
MALYMAYSTDDVYISEFFPTENFVLSQFLYTGQYTGYNKCPDAYRSLLKFDITDILSSKITIKNVFLHLYVTRKDKINYVDNTYRSLRVYSNLVNFSENTATWNNAPNISITEHNKIISGKDIGTYIQLNITCLFMKWCNRTIANNGITLLGTENVIDTLIGYDSSRSPNPPYLSIEYW